MGEIKKQHMKRNLKLLFALVITSSLAFVACNKDDSSENTTTSTLRIKMTDAPNSFDSVNIDIQEVRVKLSDDSASLDSTSTDSTGGGWRSMETNAGLYNLLDFQNGLDTVIATAPLPTQTVRQLRLILGPGSYVVVGGVTYPLTIPSGAESGLKINLNKDLNATIETILIDFDAAASIHLQGNGEYKLRPVITVR
jgi:hypothetical protein